jgi:hypothetical protein
MSTSDQSPHGAATSEAMQTVLSELISHQNECRRITKRLHLLLKPGSDSDDDRILTTADASSLTPAHAPPSPWPCVSDQDVNKCRRITKRLHLLGLDKPPRTPHTLPEEDLTLAIRGRHNQVRTQQSCTFLQAATFTSCLGQQPKFNTRAEQLPQTTQN